MGRRDKWSKGWQGQGQRSQGEAERPWHLWSGSRPSASPKAKAAASSRYDQMPVPPEKPPKGPIGGDHGNADLMREIQKIVSTARRADGRVRRLQEDKERKEAQWLAFAKKSRADFMEQRRRYEQDLLKIDEDIAAATRQGVEASAEVQDLVAHGPKPKDQPMEGPDAWDELLAAEDGPGPTTDFLGDALAAARKASSASLGSAPALSNPEGRFLQPADAARVLWRQRLQHYHLGRISDRWV